MSEAPYVTKDQAIAIAEAAAKEAAREAVRDMLLALGLDVEDADGIIRHQVDFAWLRRQRQASEQIAHWSRRTLIGLAVSGALGLLWLGLQEALKG